MDFFQASDACTAELVKVVPTPNNGYTELVRLHKLKVLYVKSAVLLLFYVTCVLSVLN
jgi:hypothetical protein